MANVPVVFEIRSGLRANLPSTGAIIGEPFFCKDTGDLFIWNGSTMKAIGGAGLVLSVSGKTGVVTLGITDITGLDALLTTYATAITDEITNRSNADSTLQSNINSEAAARASADSLLVPKTTTVNGYALSGNVTVSASDITTGTLPHAQLPSLVSGDIPNNAANTLGTAGGLSANIAESQVTNLVSDLAGKVATSVTVNGQALSSNVVISASDITTGTLPHAQLPALVSGDIPNNAANTSGTALNLSGTPALPNGTTATTQSVNDNSTKLATTAYADAIKTPPGGSTTQLQFKDTGAVFAGADLTWDKTNKILTFPALGTGAVGAGTAYSNSGSSATATASVTINAGDFVISLGGWAGGGRADVADNGTALVLTAVTQGKNGTAIYTGTITGGGSNAFAGASVTIAGFVNGVNNGVFYCLASTATTLTLSNILCLNEVHAGTAANAYLRVANTTLQYGFHFCPKAIVPATTISAQNGGSNASIGAITFTGIGGLAQCRIVPAYTTSPATDTITTAVANSMVVTLFAWSAASASTPSSSSGTLRTSVAAGAGTTLGIAAVTTQAGVAGSSVTNAVTLSATATSGFGYTLELIPAGSSFNSDLLQLQNSYWNGSAAVTDTWAMQAQLSPTLPGYGLALNTSLTDNPTQESAIRPLGKPISGAAPLQNTLTLTYTGEGGGVVSTPHLVVNGSAVIQQLANPIAPSVTPTGANNAKTYGYKVVAFDVYGNYTAASPQGSTAAGATTLSPSKFCTITWTAVPGAAYYKVFRTQSTGAPSSLSHIGTVYAGQTLSVVDDGTITVGTDDVATLSNTTGSLYTDGALMAASVVTKGTITNAGGMIVKRADKNGNYTATATDYLLAFTATATVILDSAAAVVGTTYRIKLKASATGGSVLTVSPNNSKTIDNAATLVITTLGNSVDVCYDGSTNWDIL